MLRRSPRIYVWVIKAPYGAEGRSNDRKRSVSKLTAKTAPKHQSQNQVVHREKGYIEVHDPDHADEVHDPDHADEVHDLDHEDACAPGHLEGLLQGLLQSLQKVIEVMLQGRRKS